MHSDAKGGVHSDAKGGTRSDAMLGCTLGGSQKHVEILRSIQNKTLTGTEP